jgi:23S rRNA pseudouridine1911/1915/1917 synthase
LSASPPDQELVVPAELAGTRLDRALAAASGAPRNQVQAWIEAGRVFLDGAVADRPGRALRQGEKVRWEAPPPPDPRIVGAAGDLSILHLDPDLIVLDKPPGISMHPGAARTGEAPPTLAHLLLGRFPELAGVGGPGRPGIVHRLDKETSGVVAVARTAAAYEQLSRAFAARRVEKRYLAIAHGMPEPGSGRIEQPIGRHPVKRKQMAVRAAGRPAVTLYRTRGATPRGRNRPGFSLLELDLQTGRTHQIRVHLKHLRHPIAGDPTYGGGTSGAPRLALHAWRLAFDHPRSGERVEFRAPFASDLAAWWRSIGGTGLAELQVSI